jgi:Sap, sulfolipid-1-addressing protein
VIAQASGFALLAAISPTALLLMAVFLGSANPRKTALLYVAGALVMTVVMAVTVLVVLRATGLSQPREHGPRYGLRLGLGILALAGAVIVARRRRPAADQDDKQGRGPMARIVARPGPRTAFAAGVLVFAPSAAFIAAVQAVATARASVQATTLALVLVVIISALIVWLPLLGYLAAPDATSRRLKALNGWLRANGRALLMGALGVCGLVLVVNGSTGLAGL